MCADVKNREPVRVGRHRFCDSKPQGCDERSLVDGRTNDARDFIEAGCLREQIPLGSAVVEVDIRRRFDDEHEEADVVIQFRPRVSGSRTFLLTVIARVILTKGCHAGQATPPYRQPTLAAVKSCRSRS